jgi:hypothetical protein
LANDYILKKLQISFSYCCQALVNNENLNSRQIRFVKMVDNYVVKNGQMVDKKALQVVLKHNGALSNGGGNEDSEDY